MIPWKRNFVAKALALVGAIVLWAFVMSEQNPMVEVEYSVPVHLINTQSTQIIENAPYSVDVILRGPRNTFLHMDKSTLVATVNMNNSGYGEKTLPIHFEAPSGLTLTKQTPGIAELFVDRYVERTIKVQEVITGESPKGIGIKEVKLDPQKITISGARTQVNKVAKAEAIVKIDGHRDDYKEDINISLFDEEGNTVTGVNLTPVAVKVDVTVDKDILEKRVPLNIALTGEVAAGYKVGKYEILPPMITIIGKQNIVREYENITLDPIDISQARESIKTKIAVKLPEGLKSNITEVEINIPIEKNDK